MRPRDFDWLLLVSVLLLSAVGLALIYSSTSGGDGSVLVRRQILWVGMGLSALLVAQLIPFKTYDVLAYFAYTAGILALVFVLLAPGEGGPHRWISSGPFRFQPSEIAKLLVVFALARYLAGKKKPGGFRSVLVPFAIVAVPMILVARQPDLGTAMVFGAILFPLLYWAGMEPIYVALLVTPLISMLCATALVSWIVFVLVIMAILYFGPLRAGEAAFVLLLNFAIGIVTPFLWGRLEPYQKNRILSYVNPEKDPLGSGYQILQSKVAIGSGGGLGKGFLEGTQKGLEFLPARHTDFIFSVAGEEFGFVGVLVILGLFLMVIWRGVRIAQDAKDKFASLTAMGITSVLTFHVFVNIGMTIGLLPITGLPLPLLSYGGSSCLMFMVAVGILLAIGRSRRAG
ncbi:MAG: rod shape-determining protein RodA [Candidatus Eisenbacteria sp.]|nr:rod shape-determining protein RodA [Candidatus Eisenbacteria bacterium]